MSAGVLSGAQHLLGAVMYTVNGCFCRNSNIVAFVSQPLYLTLNLGENGVELLVDHQQGDEDPQVHQHGYDTRNAEDDLDPTLHNGFS